MSKRNWTSSRRPCDDVRWKFWDGMTITVFGYMAFTWRCSTSLFFSFLWFTSSLICIIFLF